MFYSEAGPAAIFKTKQKKTAGIAGEWQLLPSTTLLTPLASAEPAKRGLRGPACCLISEMLNPLRAMWGFTQESHQSVVLEQTEITQGNEEAIGHRKKGKCVCEESLASHLRSRTKSVRH